MEEDIKTIEHIIEEYKKLDIIYNSKTPCSEITALQNLIARYKELEKNRDVKAINKKWKSKIEKRYKQLMHYDYIETNELLKLLED